MKHFRPDTLLPLLALLAVAACSRPVDVQAPALEPQFGTVRQDTANVVTADALRGRIYLAATSYTPFNEANGRGYVLSFRRYNRDGSLAWQRNANTETPNLYAFAAAADLDSAGNVLYAWNTVQDDPAETKPSIRRGFISKYSPSGTRLFQLALRDSYVRGVAADADGNIYVTTNRSTTGGAAIHKYTSGGKLVWRRALKGSDGEALWDISGLDVAPDGLLYAGAENLLGGALLLKLRGSDGRLLKRSPVGGSWVLEVKVGGGAIYVLSELDAPYHVQPYVSKFRPDGSRLWERRGFFASDENFSNLRYETLGGLSVDTQGNAYLTGGFVTEGSGAEDSDVDLFVRKYTPSGGRAYNKRFLDRNADAFGAGVVAASLSESYVVGSTDGLVDGKNNGGRDAFLLRLDGRGKQIWER